MCVCMFVAEYLIKGWSGAFVSEMLHLLTNFLCATVKILHRPCPRAKVLCGS